MTAAGADIVVCHLGLTTGGSIGAETALTLDDCVGTIDAWAAPRAVNPDVLVLCHGGPIATPEDAHTSCALPDFDGFYGASSMERLPTEIALTETTRRFTRIRATSALYPQENTMTGAQFGSFILGLIVVAIVVAIVVWLLHWLYLRSSRSALRAHWPRRQKVVLDGGAFVLPIVHDVIPVNMNTLRLEVTRGRDKALITRDRMRVDLMAEFYVRVAAHPDAVAAAAQTLGLRTMEPEQLKELVEGKFVDALRTAAAEMTMEELHEKRGAYVQAVRETVAEI